VPFSDPVADGQVIQRASERALVNGTTLGDVLKLAGSCGGCGLRLGDCLFLFESNSADGVGGVLQGGEEAGLDGALVTDCRWKRLGLYLAEMKKNELAPVFLAAPTSPEARLKRIAQASAGFVYAVARTGITE